MGHRIARSALIGLLLAIWAWLLVAAHGIWSFGIIHDYLNGGMLPLFPGIPVTYGMFFRESLPTALGGFFICTACVIAAPPRLAPIAAMIGLTIALLDGTSDLTFLFQIDFGTTWLRSEALWELFVHPIVTPFWLALALVGAARIPRWCGI
ncbi:MAG: hypothetical protein AAGL89_11700 [Pseudomonadota bacterium]